MQSQPTQGKIQVDIPAQKNKPARKAILDVSYGMFTMNPPRSNIRHKTEKLTHFTGYGIYVIEKNPPKNVQRLEWLLITNLVLDNFDAALEKVRW